MEVPFSELSTLLDKGIIAGMFVFSFVVFIWRGIPYLVSFVGKAVDKMQSEHSEQVRILTQTFENALSTITNKFILQIERQHEESARFHEKHAIQLIEIATRLQSVDETIKKREETKKKYSTN